jgi:hypothetical protein
MTINRDAARIKIPENVSFQPPDGICFLIQSAAGFPAAATDCCILFSAVALNVTGINASCQENFFRFLST